MARDTSTPQVPLKKPQIPSNRDHKTLNKGTLKGAGACFGFGLGLRIARQGCVPWAFELAAFQEANTHP